MYQGYVESASQIEAKRQAIASGKLLPSQRRAPKVTLTPQQKAAADVLYGIRK